MRRRPCRGRPQEVTVSTEEKPCGVATTPLDCVAEVRALCRMLERRRERTWTRSGSPRRPRRRAVSRRYSRRRILRALVNAHSLREAARRLDCAPSTLSRNTDPRVREAVRRFRRAPAPDWWPGDKHQIATRYGLGESLRRIAGSYGCAPRHIRDVLREADNEFATPTPRPKLRLARWEARRDPGTFSLR